MRILGKMSRTTKKRAKKFAVLKVKAYICHKKKESHIGWIGKLINYNQTAETSFFSQWRATAFSQSAFASGLQRERALKSCRTEFYTYRQYGF